MTRAADGRCTIYGLPDDFEVDGHVQATEGHISASQYTVGSHTAEVICDDFFDIKYHQASSGRLVTQQNKVELFTAVRPESLDLSPAQFQAEYEFCGETTTRSLNIHKRIFDEAIDADVGFQSTGKLEPLFGFHSARLSPSFTSQFDQLFATPNPSKSAFDELVYPIAYELLSFFSSKKRHSGPERLDPAACNKIVEFIEAGLESDIGLSDMAACLRMDIYRFSRAFRASFGTSPHQFLLSCRVERVKHLILNENYSLAEIAYACGFSSQAHMTSVFSKRMKCPPGKYKKLLMDD